MVLGKKWFLCQSVSIFHIFLIFRHIMNQHKALDFGWYFLKKVVKYVTWTFLPVSGSHIRYLSPWLQYFCIALLFKNSLWNLAKSFKSENGLKKSPISPTDSHMPIASVIVLNLTGSRRFLCIDKINKIYKHFLNL